MTDETQAARDMSAAIIAELGLTIDSEFIPFSQSRNKDQTYPSLNWLVTLKRNGDEVLSTHYGAGSAHCPAYKDPTLGRQDSVDRFKAIKLQCETGRDGKPGRPGVWIKPDALDVIYCLVMDSNVLSSSGFESWAEDYGYDADSRKAEATYRACLDTGLKLQASLGASNLERLNTAFMEY